MGKKQSCRKCGAESLKDGLCQDCYTKIHLREDTRVYSSAPDRKNNYRLAVIATKIEKSVRRTPAYRLAEIESWKNTWRELDKIKQIAKELLNLKNLLVFTGAGLSLSSIKAPPHPPLTKESIQAIQRREYYEILKTKHKTNFLRSYLFGNLLPYLTARPNIGHKAIANLEKLFKIKNSEVQIITQNLDSLHELAALDKSGQKKENILHVHGWLKTAKCPKCEKLHDYLKVLLSLKSNPNNIDIMLCSGKARQGCNGVLTPDMVEYGETVTTYPKCIDIANNSDAVLVVGTSLKVTPSNKLVEIVHREGGKIFIFNRSDTPMESITDVHIFTDLEYTIPTLVWELKKQMISQKVGNQKKIEETQIFDVEQAKTAALARDDIPGLGDT